MAFRIWKSYENENVIDNVKDQEISENIKKLENKINELQLKINEYENTFTNMNNFLNHDEEKGQMSSRQITDLYERLQSIYEKDEVNTNKIHQLENELHKYKEEIKVHHKKVEVLERRIEELQIKETEVSKPSKLKKKRNIEFTNQSDFFQQGNFSETIQRVYPQDEYENKNRKSRKVKKYAKNRSGSNSELISLYYPGQTTGRMNTFNPLKYN
ncbi:hypothetical protein [Metabacillus halosaccharovorans]|uniref:Uncharacterized protein n=1 Tax=Metabacillus halosaccharovorans TaxID=930124 RepID=A0ABT3DMI6_9BACI|nr:hypothetical protein [Metabacillus halosaccharovorans]MCV9887817.1 hypothetical protein [Metabacillus halosaccharovorans]